MSRNRQLVAIMFTDIQGYTAMMQHDEGLAIKIRERHRKIFNYTTEKFNGKILQYFGDGTLSIFTSTIEAVQCAIEMQKEFQQEPVIPVRIGIHSGDIIHSDNEIIGDGVNVASRIESLAMPGSIYISDKVYDEIKNQPSIETRSLKTFELKNVDRPVEVFAISNKGLVFPGLDEVKDESTETKDKSSKTKGNEINKIINKRYHFLILALVVLSLILIGYFELQKLFNVENTSEIPDKSIAVLAFQNMSNDPKQEYFSDGISEEILNSLARIEGLKVAGRTSSFSFKGKDTDIKTIGNKLGVSLILEGSVRKSENQVRITAQLLNVADGYHIWSEQYDRELKDIFSIQEEIATIVVDMLKLTVFENNGEKQPTNNILAYDLYLKGVYSLSRDVEGTLEALNYFQKAIELDPQFALAYSCIGDAYINASAYGIIPVNKALSEARKAAVKSISLDSKQANGHKVLAYLHLFYDWDWEAAKSEYEKAVELGLTNPNYFITMYEALLYENFDKAIRDSRKILKRDPLSNEAHWHLGLSYYLGRRYKEAITAFQGALNINPNYSEAYRGIGASYRELKMYDESIFALEKSLQLTQGQGPANMDLLATLGASGKKEELRNQLNNLHEINKQHSIPSIVFVMGYAYLGDMDEAFIWLEEIYNERFLWLLSIKTAPEWDIFHNDARFEEIIKRMNFPENTGR